MKVTERQLLLLIDIEDSIQEYLEVKKEWGEFDEELIHLSERFSLFIDTISVSIARSEDF